MRNKLPTSLWSCLHGEAHVCTGKTVCAGLSIFTSNYVWVILCKKAKLLVPLASWGSFTLSGVPRKLGAEPIMARWWRVPQGVWRIDADVCRCKSRVVNYAKGHHASLKWDPHHMAACIIESPACVWEEKMTRAKCSTGRKQVIAESVELFGLLGGQI